MLVLIIGLSSVSYAVTSTAKEEYQLQERRCANRAAENFKRDYGNFGITDTSNGKIGKVYTSHYNKRLNKCFELVTYVNAKDDNSIPLLKAIMLIDVVDNDEVATFVQYVFEDNSPVSCFIFDKTCMSENEWELLISPYMNE